MVEKRSDNKREISLLMSKKAKIGGDSSFKQASLFTARKGRQNSNDDDERNKKVSDESSTILEFTER